MQCTSWPYWRDMPDSASPPSPFISEWPEHTTEEQKIFWRTFITNLVGDLKNDVMVVESNKIDQILSLLNK